MLAEGELASHSHIAAKTKATTGWSGTSPACYLGDVTGGASKIIKEPRTYETGGNQPHNNLSPVYGVFRFQRTT